MWVLQNDKTKCKYFLPCNKTISIGRKGVDIVISGDTSVSREHATIFIKNSVADVTKLNAHPNIILTDTSKFGTYINREDRKKKVEKCMELHDGDYIEFGAQGSVFKLLHEHFNVAVSMLDDVVKSELQEALVVIGGSMINGWHHDVDYLVLKAIKLNLKVVKALVAPCNIVSYEFVFNIRDQFLNQFSQVLFEPAKYLPKFDEPTLSLKNCNFNIDLSRKKTFSGKYFSFLTKKQYDKMGPIIVAAGGEAMHLAVGISYERKTDVCFVTCDSSYIQPCDMAYAKLEEIHKFVKAANTRMIEEYEIGLSILYCDSSVYCNPKFDLNSGNALTQSLQLHSPREMWNLGKESNSLVQTKSSRKTIPSKPGEQKLEIDSKSSIPLDEGTDVVRNFNKVTNEQTNDDVKNDSPFSTYGINDIDTLRNTAEVDSLNFQSSPVKSGENIAAQVMTKKESALLRENVPTGTDFTEMLVDSVLGNSPEKVRSPFNKKRQTNQTAPPINFKKFRKIWPTYMAVPSGVPNIIETCPPLPKVIGGDDFFSSCGYNDSMSQGEANSQLQDSNPFHRI